MNQNKIREVLIQSNQAESQIWVKFGTICAIYNVSGTKLLLCFIYVTLGVAKIRAVGLRSGLTG